MTKREMCNNLKCLTGLNANQVDSFMKNIINVVVHSVVDTVAENTDGKLKHLDIEIPYVGIFNADVDDDGYLRNITLDLYNDLAEKMRDAVTNLESPIISIASDTIGNRMAEKYKSLF